MRTKDILTGIIRNGVHEILRIHDDGYRIKVTWVQGAPINSENEEILWAEYKHCELPRIGEAIANLLMTGDANNSNENPWKKGKLSNEGQFLVKNQEGQIAAFVNGVLQNNLGCGNWFDIGSPVVEWRPIE